jgi:hypothetical protein
MTPVARRFSIFIGNMNLWPSLCLFLKTHLLLRLIPIDPIFCGERSSNVGGYFGHFRMRRVPRAHVTQLRAPTWWLSRICVHGKVPRAHVTQLRDPTWWLSRTFVYGKVPHAHIGKRHQQPFDNVTRWHIWVKMFFYNWLDM